MTGIKEEFGLCVRRLRLSKSWSQEDLADKSSLDRTYIGSVERGERNVSIVNIGKIASALGVEPKCLLDFVLND